MTSAQRIYALTGAASGIGYATKQLIESRGGRVIGIDIRDADVVADLATPDGRAAMIEKVADLSGGTIDAILAIAGVDTAGPPTIAVNYYGAIATLDGLRPLLAKSSAPRAVAVSSITSVHAFDQHLLNLMLDGSEALALDRAKDAEFTYATSKRGLSRWIRRHAVRPEWAAAGIPLNAIAPGLVKTALLSRLFEDPAVERRIKGGSPMPLGGPYEPSAAAELLVWLASEANGHMTGQTIFIDGGADVVLRGDGIW